ncbi:MAG: hypothetical protein QOI56_1434 [Actinomycetota bacterium]|nr:hypothetical protein [Actinomycetota bacterium]
MTVPQQQQQGSVLEGWTEVTPELLAAHGEPLGGDELVRFYDGGPADWRVAQAPETQVLRRQAVAPAVAAFETTIETSMVLLVGPRGEGKSTTARQIAVDLVRAGTKVLFRDSGTRLDADAVAALPGGPWVLVSDDAEEIAADLESTLGQLSKTRKDVHWVLVGRSPDWESKFKREGRSAEPPWERTVNLWPTLGMRGKLLALAPVDADRLVAVWGAAGSLRAMETDPEDDRGQYLLDAVESRQGMCDATLLGGILDQRFGADALPDHVATLIAPLADADLDAFLSVAVADACDFDGVDLAVVADLAGVDRSEAPAIRRRLVDHGVGSGSGPALRSRHPAIAKAAVRLVDAGRVRDRNLDDVWRRLVQSMAKVGRELGPLVSDGPIMTCGPVLAGRYERFGIPRDGADRVARVVADEAAVAMGDRFSLFSVLQARTYRLGGLPAEASAILRKAFPEDVQKQDWDRMGRGFLYELALAEAAQGHLLETITLAGLSMADARRFGPVTYTDAKIALVEIGEACLKMDEAQLLPRYAGLLRAAAVMSPTVTPKWDQPTRARFRAYTERADELDLPECKLA